MVRPVARRVSISDIDCAVRRVVDVPAKPFHALAARDGGTIYVALANGNIPCIDVASGEFVAGGFNAGGTMPEALIYLNS